MSAIGQIRRESCKKIKIAAPETVAFGHDFKVTASYDDENQPSISKFDWFVVKEREGKQDSRVIFIGDRGTVDLNSWIENEGGSVTLIAKSRIPDCDQITTSKIYILPNIGTPLTLDEYGKLSWSDEKGRLDAIVLEMKKYEDSELVAFISFSPQVSHTARKSHVERMLTHLTQTRNLKPSRLTFVICESERYSVRFQPVLQQFIDNFALDECIRIDGEKFIKYKNLFK